ncbi:hypothetical protein JCM8547_001449 [Rhodosporidiobolus lusitaniae]
MSTHTLLASGYGGVIQTLSLDLSSTPSLSITSSVSAGNAPTWLTLSPDKSIVYTGDEFAEPAGTITAFSLSSTGEASPLGTVPCGAGPVHFVLSPGGKTLYSANYGGGSLSAVKVGNDGKLVEGGGEQFDFTGTGPNKDRQEAPHIHGVYLDPTGNYLLATDLGTDELKAYRIGQDDKLEALPSLKVAPGAGPRHLAFSQHSGKTLIYMVEELASEVDIFELVYPSSPSDGLALKPLQLNISVLPPHHADYPAPWDAAEVGLSKDGKWLYVSNRAPLDPHPESDTLIIFQLDGEGKVDKSQIPTYFALGGRGPRAFAFHEAGRYLAVSLQRTNEVVVFEVEGKDVKEVARVKDVKEPTAIVWV